MNPFQAILVKKKLREEKIQEAREKFTNWREISGSIGWKVYESVINKKIEYIKEQMANNHGLTGEDLKKLQLALQVWRQVVKIPKDLEEDAKKGRLE